MRFISIFTHEPNNKPPTEAEMARMGQLIEDAMKAGWLIATEGGALAPPGFACTRVPAASSGSRTGPFAEAKEGSRRLRAPPGREQGRDRRTHPAFPRRRRSGNVRDLSAL